MHFAITFVDEQQMYYKHISIFSFTITGNGYMRSGKCLECGLYDLGIINIAKYSSVILLITHRMLKRTREVIHVQHRNTTRDWRAIVVLFC